MTIDKVEKSRLEFLLSFSKTRKQLTGCWTVSEALSYRVAFLFQEGSILTISAEGEVWLEASKPNSTPPGKDWEWGKRRGVFVLSTLSTDLGDLLVQLIEERGKPKLIVPWEDWERVTEQMTELEDEEQMRVCEKFESDVIKARETALWSELEFTYGEDCLPTDCDYVNFEALIEDLEEENWIVIKDECCGTCAAGNIRDARESEPGMENAPAFVIYGQGADNYFFSDGAIKDFMFAADELGQERELDLARKHGFKVAAHGDHEGLFLLNPS